MAPMSRGRRALAWAALALLASVLPAALGRRAPLPEAATSGLAFAPDTLDFGTVYSGERVAREFPFRNGTERPIRIVEAASTCGCLQAEPSARWIAPGAEGVVRATLVTDGRYGPQRLRIHVRTDDGAVPLTLTGTVRAALRPRPPRIFLAGLEPGTRLVEEIALDVLEPPVTGLAVAARGAGLAAEIVTEQPARITLRATIDVPFATGARFGGLLVTGQAAGRAFETWIPVVWVVPRPLIVDPPELKLADGRGVLAVRPRWPGVARLVAVDTGDLPLRAAIDADGARVTVERTGAAWEIPVDARLRLVVEPASLGVVEVPLLP